MAVRVSTGGRLHFGFQNLSLAHERLYGSLGLALDAPQLVLKYERAERIAAQTAIDSSRSKMRVGVPASP